MKKNTACSPGGEVCPQAPATDVAKSRSMGCEVKHLTAQDFERTRVLKEFELKIPTEAEIKLPSYARDIKNIRKNVHLTQCKAVQELGNYKKVTLFVEGYVHKNIQYAESSNGYLRDYSINVPFKCYEIIYLEHPTSYPHGSSKNSSGYELREIAKNNHEADRHQFGSQTWEINNEPIHCKLLYSVVDQWDIAHNHDNWGRFNKLTEKMRVTLGIKLTQKQQYSETCPPYGSVKPVGESETQNTVAERMKRITRESV